LRRQGTEARKVRLPAHISAFLSVVIREVGSFDEFQRWHDVNFLHYPAQG